MASRTGRVSRALACAFGLVLAAGCEVRSYPFGSGTDGGGVTGSGNRDGGFVFMTGPGMGKDGSAAPLPDGSVRLPDGAICAPTPEICDGEDSDCDGVIDNGFDLMTNPGHCGRCGQVCTITHAFPTCEQGACKIMDCLPGWFDVDKNIGNGCECLRSNGGVELCDGADNDCDGLTDEDFAFKTDLKNCGACGVICDYPHAAPTCTDTGCRMGACDADRIDLNNDSKDGCEYECTRTADPAEICDGRDNDCDGGIDNNPVDEGAACGPNVVNIGVCKRGMMICTSGRLFCIGATQPGIEFCDGNDNNCDGQTDEGFDKLSDIRYCGNCAPCLIPNAVGRCDTGVCNLGQCSPGFVDLDMGKANGCEYECTFTGVDVCNARDDDCDGMTDEGIDKTTDVNNCGQCGLLCNYPNAMPICSMSACQQGPCNTNFHDIDAGKPGCEYFCVNTGAEACDGVDNDCNGQTDEGFDLTMDINNCGTCGQRCQFSNAGATCSNRMCFMGGCNSGYVNADNNNANGCEYQCSQTNGGVEICDSKDNDCDTMIDEADPQLDAACFPNGATGCDVMAGTCAGICVLGQYKCLGGALACQGAQLPRPELCDSIDNDCDAQTDEDFDKLTDPRYCGGCAANCSFLHAVALCSNGACSMGPCLSGWVDLNMDGNGCEYACSKDGPEVCDGKDNDCDGLTDDADSDILFPVTNFCRQIGECGNNPAGGGLPRYPQNTFPVCMIPSGGTVPDWVCNYPASVQQTGVNTIAPQESWCDGLDNDCDGATDEYLPTLGNSCADTGIGECQRIGVISCKPGDRTAAPECAYAGAAKTADHELCDGKDNDCDGQTDEIWDNPGTGCSGQACRGVRDAVVNSGGTYVYQYEASRPNAGVADQGSLSTRACSRTNVLPWTAVTYAQAQAACNAAGKRLCRTNRVTVANCVTAALTSDEWGTACAFGRGGCGSVVFPYGCSYDAATCNGLGKGVGAMVATGAATVANCVTNDIDGLGGRVNDLSGNVSEWTEDCTGMLNGKHIYTLRGGDYLSGYASGVPSALQCNFVQVGVTETYSHPSTGFRCCTTCAPGQAECSGICRNLAGDINNCGACGAVCAGTCVNGTCQ